MKITVANLGKFISNSSDITSLFIAGTNFASLVSSMFIVYTKLVLWYNRMFHMSPILYICMFQVLPFSSSYKVCKAEVLCKDSVGGSEC